MSTDHVVVVSGLPRSGTSMMMRMLDHGGVVALTDGLREGDIDNPNGYYEYEPVKQTKEDPSWVPLARGKVVKMVYRLLYDLPAGFEYRVIMMRREMTEVLASQDKMLERLGKGSEGPSSEVISDLYRKQMSEIEMWLQSQPNFTFIEVHYSDVLEAPELQSARVNEFLGGNLDTEKMAAVVSHALYRNRTST